MRLDVDNRGCLDMCWYKLMLSFLNSHVIVASVRPVLPQSIVVCALHELEAASPDRRSPERNPAKSCPHTEADLSVLHLAIAPVNLQPSQCRTLPRVPNGTSSRRYC